MRSLHEMHGENALCAGRVCPSVCPHDSTREPLDGLGLNLVRLLCHSRLPQNRTFEYPTIGDNKIADEKIREVERQYVSGVLHSGGKSENYRSLNLFVWSGCHGYPG
jgi:hypothetical protein